MTPVRGVASSVPGTGPHYAPAPDPVRHRRMDQERPERDEGQIRPEAHPLDDRPRNERHRDDRKRPLAGHEEKMRDRPPRAEPRGLEEEVRTAAPIHPLPGVEARLQPRTTQAIPIAPSDARLINLVMSTFFERTSPGRRTREPES